MAWPPPVLPINRTNADPQQDTHPNDHNALALAINDTAGHLGGLGDPYREPASCVATISAGQLAGTGGYLGLAITGGTLCTYGTPGGTPSLLMARRAVVVGRVQIRFAAPAGDGSVKAQVAFPSLGSAPMEIEAPLTSPYALAIQFPVAQLLDTGAPIQLWAAGFGAQQSIIDGVVSLFEVGTLGANTRN